MSRRDSRDFGSKRHRSRFDREPSPERSRRDEKDERERITSISILESANHTDQDHKHQPRLQDTLPLECPLAPNSKVENGAFRKESDKKPRENLEGAKNSSGATEAPRSRSYFQHDERGNSGQAVRSSNRGSTAERGSWRDSKDDRAVSKTTTNDSRPRNEKPKGDENRTWRHDGFFEMEADPPARKRPSFREKKTPVVPENGEKTTVETSTEGVRKSDERGGNPRHLDRSEKQFPGERVPYRGEVQRGVFSSRERYSGGAGRNHRGRDRLSGRQGCHSGGSGGRAEKWKHDLYHEANRGPTTKNEEDQIAKVETLLAS